MTVPRAAALDVDRGRDGRFRTIASEQHFTGRILGVRTDTVTMPGGGTARREVVDHMAAVAIVALDEAGQVVLIEQYRHPLRRRLWELPAGLMDIPGEEPLTCAQRELREEAALAATNWSPLVDLATSPGFCTEAIRVFKATGLHPVDVAPRVDEEADLTVVRVPLAEAARAVLRGDIVNATAVAGILAAACGEETLLARPWSASPARPNEGAMITDAPPLEG